MILTCANGVLAVYREVRAFLLSAADAASVDRASTVATLKVPKAVVGGCVVVVVVGFVVVVLVVVMVVVVVVVVIVVVGRVSGRYLRRTASTPPP